VRWSANISVRLNKIAISDFEREMSTISEIIVGGRSQLVDSKAEKRLRRERGWGSGEVHVTQF